VAEQTPEILAGVKYQPEFQGYRQSAARGARSMRWRRRDKSRHFARQEENRTRKSSQQLVIASRQIDIIAAEREHNDFLE
jgi:hypothetical protein